MKKHENFLKLNDKPIFFINENGQTWISLPSLCEALDIDTNRYYRNAKRDYIIGPELRLQPVPVTSNGITQIRNVTCIPETLVYGWLFTVKAERKELKEYKKTCYYLLHNYFKGSITNRKDLLLERKTVETEIFKVKRSLKEEDEKYKKLEELKRQKRNLNTKLNHNDKELIDQPELFDQFSDEQVSKNARNQ